MRNLHKAYYKDYYNDLNFGYLLNNGEGSKIEIMRRNTNLTATNLLQKIHRNPSTNQSFELIIAYPGLVTGVGINHEAKIEGEFKLGVHFDWTYGMPVIYGSSVKGVLRYSFLSKTERGKIIEYDGYFLEKVTKRHWDPEEIKILFDGIFEGKDKDGKNYSIYNRDIFFDAVITQADKKGRILCSDSITPHDDNPLKNPVPITFLKIAPGCKLEFRFKLVDTQIGDYVFTIEDKLLLFKKILTTVGIGAKTNVGYGQLKSI